MSGTPSAQLAIENEIRRLREQIAGLERMLAGETAHQSALSDGKGPEDAVDQTQKMLAELVERAPFGIYIVDSQFRIAHTNAAAQAGLFRSVQSVIGRDLADTIRMLWPDTVAAGIITAFRHTLNTGEPHYALRFSNLPYDVESVEGYEWELYRMTLPDGQYRVVCCCSDSTRLRQAETALRESEGKYRSLFESIEQGFCTIEMFFDENEKAVDFRFLLVNPAFERQTGLRNATCRRIRELVPLLEEHWFETYGRVALTGEPLHFENPSTHVPGYYEVFAWRIGVPSERKVAILFNDVSERKRTEQELAADVAALSQIHSLSTSLLESAELEPLLQRIMDAAVNIMGADRGTLKLVEGDSLLIVAHHGHERPYLDFFNSADGRVSVAEAMKCGERVVIENVESSPIFVGSPSFAVLREAGVRAINSTPLRSRNGALLGILTTQWKVPHVAGEHDLWRIDLLVRQAADLIEQNRAERALRRIADLPERNPDPVLRLGPGGALDYANAAARSWLASMGAAEDQPLPCVLQGLIERIGPERPVIEGEVSDERGRTYLFTAVQQSSEGTVTFYGRDITERKQAEEALRSNQARLMDSERLAKVGSWDMDVATRKSRWSDEWYRIFGLPRDARPEFQTFLSCVHPKDRGMHLEAENRSHSTDEPFVVQYRIIRPDGEVRLIRSIVESIRNKDGVVVRLAGASQDVTEQVKATELLRESEARLKAAEQLTHVGNWIWDIKANRLSWSEEIFQIMGQTQDYQPSYEDFLKMTAPAEKDRLEQWVRDCLAEKKGSLIETHLVRPSGDVRTVVCTAEVLLDEDGSPERLFGTCQDVTDARRAQEESFDKLKLESLGTLASGIAHDFNNLLGAVLAQTELAMAELGPGSPGVNEGLNSIRDVAIRGSEIVRQLMIYAGKESDVVELVDVSKAVQGMLGLLRVAVSRHVTLITDLGEDLPAVPSRTAQLSQIVMNLVVNASDAIGDRDGVIRVTTRHVAIGQAEADKKMLTAGDYVQLEVSDTGCGMSAETQARIFDPFFTTKFSGRGLGLAVVSGIIRSLRGAIQVTTEAGKGTTFEVLLPCAQPGAHRDDTRVFSLDESASTVPSATILLVEDEEPLRLAIAKMLRKWGLETFEATSGSAAIDLLRTKSGEIDLMLLDLTIPGASSQEVLAEAAVARPKLKVVLTSAYSEEAAKPLIGGPLVCGFIRKPFKIVDLAQQLRSVLVS